MRTACLALLFFATTAAAQGTAMEDGARAPVDRWYVRGGCAARTGAADARAPRLAPRPAWTYRVRGEIEGEPLVWDDYAVLTVRESAGRRAIHVVDLAGGRRRSRQTLQATTPLAAALWDGRLAVRPAPNRIDLYRLAGSRLLPLRSIQAAEAVSEPLLFEGELYVREGPVLVRYDLGRREPVWSASVPGSFRGTPALRGDHVYAVWYDGRGTAHLAGLARGDGKITGDIPVGRHGGRIPDASAPVDLVVFERDVFVHLPLSVEGPEKAPFFVTRARRAGGGFDPEAAASLHAFPLDPVAVPRGWVALEERSDTTRRWVTARVEGETLRGLVLADRDIHPELLADPRPPSTAGDVLFLQGLAVETEDFTIRWRVPRPPRGRVVPIENGLLAVSAPHELTALVGPTPAPSSSVARARKAVAEMEEKIAAGYAALVPKALRTNDLELAERFLAAAFAGGAKGRTLDLAQENLLRMLDRDTRPAASPRLTKALLDEERAFIANQRAALLLQARTAADGAFRRRLLRILLELDPDAPAVTAAVRELVPPDAPRGAVFDPWSWLDFLDARADAPVEFVLPPADGARSRDTEKRTLAREAKEWRPDVAGYGSESLFVVTPPGRPGAVGAMLDVGELVCDILKDVFDATGEERDRERLRLFLYESREEYLAQSQRSQSRPEVARGWTAGHFDPADGISRMFVPVDDDAYARLLRVYAHELTHHWLLARSPFAGSMGPRDQRGYWIVEGFAGLIEEFVLDPAAGTWDPHDPRAGSLDLVANARPTDLLPWDRVFSLARDDIADLSTERDRSIPRTWQLGARLERSEIDVFYAQAAAACHFLFEGDEGRHRAALLAYVRDWYERDETDLTPGDAFGLSPNALGERIVAFARTTSAD